MDFTPFSLFCSVEREWCLSVFFFLSLIYTRRNIYSYIPAYISTHTHTHSAVCFKIITRLFGSQATSRPPALASPWLFPSSESLLISVYARVKFPMLSWLNLDADALKSLDFWLSSHSLLLPTYLPSPFSPLPLPCTHISSRQSLSLSRPCWQCTHLCSTSCPDVLPCLLSTWSVSLPEGSRFHTQTRDFTYNTVKPLVPQRYFDPYFSFMRLLFHSS